MLPAPAGQERRDRSHRRTLRRLLSGSAGDGALAARTCCGAVASPTRWCHAHGHGLYLQLTHANHAWRARRNRLLQRGRAAAKLALMTSLARPVGTLIFCGVVCAALAMGLRNSFGLFGEVVMPVTKQPTSIRLDPDVLDWFKRKGKGYQTRINAVLRTYVEAQRKGGKMARR